VTRHGTLFGRAAVLAAGALVALALTAAPAGAATKLHFFQKPESQLFLDPSGNPITNPNAPPAVGDQFIFSDRDYVGNKKHHAKHWTATDHLQCTVTSVSSTGAAGLCNGQIAIGGSMLLAENVKLDLSDSGTTTVPITGGTGKFIHMKGTARSVGIGKTNDSEFTIELH
jgi:hypothetical protein